MEEDKNTLDLHTEVREEDRVAKAVALFKEGYNCSQSVVTAFADLYGFTREQALHMSASFGGGIGRMREPAVLLAACSCWPGWRSAPSRGKTVRARRRITLWCRNWPKNSRSGTAPAVCRFAGIVRKEPVVSTPEARTERYYAKRPCARMVEEAARIWSEHLEKQKIG